MDRDRDPEVKSKYVTLNNVRAYLHEHITGFGRDGSFITQILQIDKVLLYAMVLYSYKFDYLINNRYNEFVLETNF